MAAPVQDIYVRLERFKKIDPITGCWLWRGKTDKDGYGCIGYKGRDIRVHRLSAHLYRGFDLDSPLLICHKDDICPNKSCFNPDHTFEGTFKDNNAAKDLCRKGHNCWYVNRKTKIRYCRICIANSPSRLRRLKNKNA